MILNDTLLVTLDVKSLCTSIPKTEAIKVMREAYDGQPTETVATKVFITILSLILTRNNFVFNSIKLLNNGMCNWCPSIRKY